MTHNNTSKAPIDTSELKDLADDTPTIPDACLDYLGIEHRTTVSDVTNHIRKDNQQRFLTGESVLVKFKSVEYVDEEETELKIEADIDYSALTKYYDDPSKVLSGLRLKGNDGATSGSFVNAIPLNTDGTPNVDGGIAGKTNKVPTLTIEDLKIENPTDLSELKKEEIARKANGPIAGSMTLSGLSIHKEETRFVESQRILSIGDDDEDPFEISEGDVCLLDKTVSDHTAESAMYALQNPEFSDFNTLLEGFMDGSENNESDKFTDARIEDLIEWTRSDSYSGFGLNDKQAKFVRDASHELSLLQGPPGTGKTSGAIAPAIVSRLLAYNGDNGPCRTLVTGASNKSIDEVMGDTVAFVDEYITSDATDDALDDVIFLRASKQPNGEDTHVFDDTDEISAETLEKIAYTPFHGGDAQDKYLPSVHSRLTRPNISDNTDKHIIVFATARRAWRVAKAVIDKNSTFRLDGGDSDDEARVNGPEPPEHELREHSLFDVLVADEASMMDLPSFLLSATFYSSGGNILLSGDHRQLPPVQQYDWDSEFRPSITSIAPYLSVLNFFRLLRGEELHVLDDEFENYLSIDPSAIPHIPLHQLEITYRCHTRITDFLREWVYMKLDGLEYQSDQTGIIPKPNPTTNGVGVALEPDTPLTLVTYDDTSHQQSNPLEAQMIAEMLNGVDRTETSTGIVTPHNAQRGLLDTQLSKSFDDENPPSVIPTDIDTVERFQGGERDMMVLSGTVTDPDYIAAESDFLLNLNRLNVAMSRMKQKLVVVAGESIFDHIPTDVEEYNQALLWKGLADEAGLADEDRNPDWEGSVTDFTGLSESEFVSDVTGTTVRVYCV